MEDIILSPSLLAADFGDLKGSLYKIQKIAGSYVHIDVMDGLFVPQISFGQPVIKSLRPLTKHIFDVHLMIMHPENHFESFKAAGADIITFHKEAAIHTNRFIGQLHDMGLKAGVAICPATPVGDIELLLEDLDLVLVMSVNPGFGGQKFLPVALKKIAQLAKIKKEYGLKFNISVDGGINNTTLQQVAKAGANIVVSGSSFFKGELEC